MNTKSAPATILLGTAALLALAALSWVGLLSPALGSIGEAKASRADTQSANDNMRLELIRLRGESSGLPAIDALASRLAAVIPPTAAQPDFFAQVARVASDAGLAPQQVTAVSPGVPVIPAADGTLPAPGTPATSQPPPPDGTTPAAPTTEVAVQEVTIEVQGSYPQLVKVLHGLESMPRGFLVRSVQADSSTDGVMTLSVVGNTFVSPTLRPTSPR